MTNKKYAVLTDSASDMPYELEKTHKIDIMNFGITLDGAAYMEREDFDFDQYYNMLRTCSGMPATSLVTAPRFLAKFEEYDKAGIEEVLYVSINAGGSATHDAACMAAQEFCTGHPASGMKITIVDSHCYSMAYGWFVIKAKEMLEQGKPMQDVSQWLCEIFAQMEIVLAAFSLKFMKKSGRISAAAAFAGEILGVRPIISLNDGISKVEKKVRGDKEVFPAMIEHIKARTVGDFYGVGGTSQEGIEEMAKLCEKQLGTKPACLFKLGAAVATNTGPDAVGVVFLGKARRKPKPPTVFC